MAGEKRFRTSFFGFNTSDVNFYIERMLQEFDDRLKKKEDEITTLKNQNREIRIKYEDMTKRSQQIDEERARIADVLIKAQEKGQLMIDDARVQAMEEKRKLDTVIEKEKEKLIDIKQEIKLLKSEVVSTLKKYEEQLNDFVSDESEASGNSDMPDYNETPDNSTAIANNEALSTGAPQDVQETQNIYSGRDIYKAQDGYASVMKFQDQIEEEIKAFAGNIEE